MHLYKSKQHRANQKYEQVDFFVHKKGKCILLHREYRGNFFCILAKEVNTIFNFFSHISGFTHGPQSKHHKWKKRGWRESTRIILAAVRVNMLYLGKVSHYHTWVCALVSRQNRHHLVFPETITCCSWVHSKHLQGDMESTKLLKS